MSFPKLTIQPPRTRRFRGKDRTFSAHLLGFLTADDLWDLGPTADGTRRPVWLAYFASVGAIKPFTANLRAGRKAWVGARCRLEIPKSSPHRWVTQTVPGGLATIVYLPELLHLEPPTPFTEDIRFLVAPSRTWIDAQAASLETDFGSAAPDAVRAALFAAYLDRRTHLPVLRDLRFHLALYQAALEKPWVTQLSGLPDTRCLGIESSNLDQPITCSVSAQTFGELLVRETERFHRQHLAPSRPFSLDLSSGAGPLQLSLGLDLPS